MAANLTPHPLVAGIAAELDEKGLPLKKKGGELVAAKEAAATGTPPKDDRGELKTVGAEDAKSIVGLAALPDVPEMVTFAGYVGARITRDAKDWCVFYLDSRLLTWLLVPTDGIVFRDAVQDDLAPCGVQDVLWVKADTTVGRGSGSLSIEGQFLSGEFTRAGDFEAGPTGGTQAAATGVFCEARSPGCCRPCTVRTR